MGVPSLFRGAEDVALFEKAADLHDDLRIFPLCQSDDFWDPAACHNFDCMSAKKWGVNKFCVCVCEFSGFNPSLRFCFVFFPPGINPSLLRDAVPKSQVVAHVTPSQVETHFVDWFKGHEWWVPASLR